ncbi:hypothetical protein QL285_079854 [Trifolium repens]|nr:hypothetical protein QL285_079854 [Trifolium repens]
MSSMMLSSVVAALCTMWLKIGLCLMIYDLQAVWSDNFVTRYYDIMDKASQVSPTYVHWMFMSFVPWIWLGNMAYYGCIVLCYSGDFLAMPIFG